MNEKLQAARKRRYLRQWDVSLAIGVNCTVYAHWEQGTRNPSRTNKAKLYALFETQDLGFPVHSNHGGDRRSAKWKEQSLQAVL